MADGEFMVLLGPSGCGKSTALRMIAGLEPITSGTVAIDGRVVNHVPAKDRDIAMVFQSYALYPHMNVLRQSRLRPAPARRRRATRSTAACRRAPSKLGLAPFSSRKPHALSGGQRQRVALGRAIVREPKVFLFDEPLSNLDAALRVTTRNELIQQQRRARHDHDLRHPRPGRGDDHGRPHLHHEPGRGRADRPRRSRSIASPANTFVARFLGNPPMNLLAARLERRGRRRSARAAAASSFGAAGRGSRRVAGR